MPPDELGHSLPRPVRLTGGGRWIFAAATLLVLGGIAEGIEGTMAGRRIDAAAGREAARMATQGLETQAAVTRLWEVRGRFHSYYVAYRYTVTRQAYEGHNLIAWQHWRSLQVGAPIAVRYLASDPTYVYPAADPPTHSPAWEFPLMVSTAFAVVGAWLLWMLWRQSYLLANGDTAPAAVTRCVATPTGRGGVTYRYTYEFRLPGGGTRQETLYTSLSDGKPPDEGSVICILYLPNNPRRNRPYPLDFVKAA